MHRTLDVWRQKVGKRHNYLRMLDAYVVHIYVLEKLKNCVSVKEDAWKISVDN
jgi:hypothetical protein